jgi:uncharacterized protein (TIGR02453 family)
METSTIQFLKRLKQNNNKEWFDKNRLAYDAARNDFEQFVQQVIDQHGKLDASIASLKAKECMFRINRDIRFAKDKSPYKTNFGASINLGGKKSIFAGYYFHLEPGKSFAGGGIWMPLAPELQKIRQEIDYCFDDFKKIIGNKKFKAMYGDLEKSSDISLTKVPKGYEKDNPAADYLKLKSFLATRSLDDADLTSKNVMKITTDAFAALQPLIQFINHSLK